MSWKNTLRNWKNAFLEIYKNFCQGRGVWLRMMIIFATIQIASGSFIILYSYQGILAIILMGIMIYGWVFFLPAFVYLVDSEKKRAVKLSEIKVKKGEGLDGFS